MSAEVVLGYLWECRLSIKQTSDTYAGRREKIRDGIARNDAPRLLRGDFVEIVHVGRAHHIEDTEELVLVIVAGEKGSSVHYASDTTSSMLVPGEETYASLRECSRSTTCRSPWCTLEMLLVSIALARLAPQERELTQHDLRRAIPPRGHVFRHEPVPALAARIGWRRRGRPGKAKVAYLQIAIRVEQQVGRFQVAVEDVGGVEGFESADGL